jgi:hypothetical protein
MNKGMIYTAIGIGGGIGGYIPSLLGDNSLLSGWAILGSTVGSLLGIYVVYKIYQG